MNDCLFCKMATGQIPVNMLYQDHDVFAIADIKPQAPQHILLMPRRHIVSMSNLAPDDGPVLTSLFAAGAKLAHDLDLDERGYRFVTNVGPDAGQSVFHMHFHLLGGRPFGWPPG